MPAPHNSHCYLCSTPQTPHGAATGTHTHTSATVSEHHSPTTSTSVPSTGTTVPRQAPQCHNRPSTVPQFQSTRRPVAAAAVPCRWRGTRQRLWLRHSQHHPQTHPRPHVATHSPCPAQHTQPIQPRRTPHPHTHTPEVPHTQPKVASAASAVSTAVTEAASTLTTLSVSQGSCSPLMRCTEGPGLLVRLELARS